MAYCPSFLFRLGSALDRDMKDKLRIGRIPIQEKTSDPWLFLNIDCLRIETGSGELGHAVHLNLMLNQGVTIESTGKFFIGTTWMDSYTVLCRKDECENDIRNAAKELYDEFLTELLNANEKNKPHPAER